MARESEDNVWMVADRFVMRSDCDGVDLASGRSIELAIDRIGGPSEHARWLRRCDDFATLRHPHLARLVDYGLLDQSRRFEAWARDGPWRGSSMAGDRALRCARQWLAASGLTADRLGLVHLRAHDARPVVVPDAQTGRESDTGVPPSSGWSIDVAGVRTIGREEVRAVSEVFEQSSGRRPIILGLTGAPDLGLRTALLDLARTARACGYLPITARLIGPRLARLVRHRSVALIVDTRIVAEVDGWRLWLDLLGESPRPHIVIFAGERVPASVRQLCLKPVPVDALVHAVVPMPPTTFRARVLTAAERSRGRPGQFVRLLWGRQAMREPDDRLNTPRAAETASCFGDNAKDESAGPAATPSQAWPAARELTVQRKRMAEAVASLRRGRHAQADRHLRAVAAFFARRQSWRQATEALCVLAESLLKRGRVRDAHAVLSEAKSTPSRTDDPVGAVTVATLLGTVALEDGRLDEAESILSGVVSAAAGYRQPRAERAARFALARCLFWRGQFAEGRRLLEPIDPAPLGEGERVRLAVEHSRLAIGSGDFECGISAATAALLGAERSGDAGWIAVASRNAAFAHLAVGDSVSTEATVRRAVDAARRAHDPLLALRARLLGAENQRRQANRRGAQLLVGRVRKMSGLPLLVRARADLLAALLNDPDASDVVVAKHVHATGLGGLALFAPAARPRSPSADAPVTTDVVDLLQCCHAAEDDGPLLTAMCRKLRERLRAAAVGFFVDDRDQPVLVASDGARIDAAIAARILTLDQPLLPRAADACPAGGAPVRYGGKRLGVLVARWTLAAAIDVPASAVLLATAATAAAPALAGLVNRRAPMVSPASQLLGASGAMDGVRRSVERAAAAPFAVLIEGESGSGKELVARALHRQGPRRDRPFCTLNCAALPDDLVESELFGHARGAFTGAIADRPGVFEEAHTGTLFLDEVGELSLRAQAKVLRTIQEGELRRVGENIGRRVDVRLVAATNRDLRREVADGRFRLDLLYRLDVIRIVVPPLRERRDDIPVLAEHFWREATARLGSRATLGTPVIAGLARYDWPGNVREMQNVLAALAVRSPRRGVVGVAALPPQFNDEQRAASLRLDDARRTFDECFIRAALARAGGRRTRAADELGISRQGLSKLMVRLGIPADADDAASS